MYQGSNVRYERNMETQDINVRCLNMRNTTKNHASTLPANVLNYKPIDTPIDTTRYRSFTTTTDEETMKIKTTGDQLYHGCTCTRENFQSKLNRTPPASTLFWESIDVAAQL